MSSKAWRLGLVAALAAGSMAIAACGDSKDDSTSSSGGSSSSSSGSSASADLASCKFTFGLMAPITGDAASIGQEQLNWAKYSVETFNQENGTKFALEEGDTQLDPAQASTVAQQLVSNNAVKAIVGPAGSQEVEAVGPVLDRAEFAYISPSATKTDLAGGKYKGFSRVVPSDAVQGPTDADYIAGTLGAKKVQIVDDQTSYSTGLADEVEKDLKAKGVNVSRTSVRRTQTDFSAVISKLAGDVDVVFLPWQIAANAQQFGDQLKEQGKSAKIFGSDGVYSPDDFSVEGSYISSFAPDITSIASSKDVADGYKAKYGSFGTFGPPVYVASQVVMTAAKQACEGGNADPSRGDIAKEVRNVSIPDSILGQPIAFEANGDVKDAKFFIFTVKNKKFTGAPGQS
jgi:branched-chain amino acid transport system substrate-binding protein